MIKTNVAGLYTDGKGVVVNRDLSEYYAEVARRQREARHEEVMEQVGSLREQVTMLARIVQELMEKSK